MPNMPMNFFEKILRWIFPPFCAICRKEGFLVCEECRKKMVATPKQEILHQKMPLFSFFPYRQKSVSQVVKTCKYKFQKEIFLRFADDLEKFFPQKWLLGKENIVLVPVPLHRKRIFFRGFNQSQMLAEIFLSFLHARFSSISVESILIRSKNTPPQAQLKTQKERQKNMENAFVLTEEAKKKSKQTLFILVDDVCSSGSTLEEMRKELEKNGFFDVVGIVFARP